MTSDWHRSEPRDVRPFFTTQKAESALDQSGIRLTADGEVTKETSFELGDGDLRSLAPTIFPDLANPQMWLPEGLAATDLEMLLIARQSLLKRSEVLSRYRLDEQIPEELEICPDVLKSLGGGRNTQITLALVLANDREPEPGTPFVGGHWIAKKTFSFRSRSNPVLFDIRPRTDEEWASAGYPTKTLYAVEYQGGIESPPDEGVGSVAVVYVHADAHNRMVDSKLGDSVQPLLASEIISSILQYSLSDWDKLDEAPKGSALETLIKQLRKSSPITLAELATIAKTKPFLLRALVQNRLGVVQALK